MPRHSRIVVPGVPFHLIQRGNNRTDCFASEGDYRFYLANLYEQARQHGCLIHAYCLMTNHVHLLVTPTKPDSLGQMMKGVGQRYVPYFNRTYGRSGTLWEGRFRSCLMEDEAYVLACYRYIELNPVRAGMVDSPAQYRWSSYHFNAHGDANALCVGHRLYQALAGDAASRQVAYRALIQLATDPDQVDRLRAATNGNFALGSAPFVLDIEHAVGRPIVRVKRGRPRKPRGSTHGSEAAKK